MRRESSLPRVASGHRPQLGRGCALTQHGSAMREAAEAVARHPVEQQHGGALQDFKRLAEQARRPAARGSGHGLLCRLLNPAIGNEFTQVDEAGGEVAHPVNRVHHVEPAELTAGGADHQDIVRIKVFGILGLVDVER